MHESVLAYVAGSLAQKENLATAALTYILNRTEPGRAALQALIEHAIGPMPKLASLWTEQATDDAKRPDILLVGTDGQRIGYIEVKFWAGLTDAQPVDYLKELAASPNSVLAVLAPDRRLQTLRNEFFHRCKTAELDLTAQSDVSLQCGTTRLALLSWTRVLEQLARATIDDRGAAADLDQLRGLCERVESEGFFGLTRQEIDDIDTPRRYLMLTGLVDDIVERAIAVGLGSVKRLKVTPYRVGYGRYMLLEYAGFWIGVDHDLWARHGVSPIWLHYYPGDWGQSANVAKALKAWLLATPPRAHRVGEDGRVVVPVPLLAGSTREEAVARAIDLLRELNASMRAAGMQANKGRAETPD